MSSMNDIPADILETVNRTNEKVLGEGPWGRLAINPLSLHEDYETFRTLTPDQIRILKPLLFKRLTLHANMATDQTVRDRFGELLAQWLPYSKNTSIIDFNLVTDDRETYDDSQSVRRVQIEQILRTCKKFFENVNPKAIEEVSLQVGYPDGHQTTIGVDYTILDTERYAAFNDIIDLTSNFINLTKFEYYSYDLENTFELRISEVVTNLPKLEELIIARVGIDGEKWSRDMRRGQDSKMIAERFSSLTQLKRLELYSLNIISEDWLEVEWKCPLEFLKVVECTSWVRTCVFKLAHLFRNTLTELFIGEVVDHDLDEETPTLKYATELVKLTKLTFEQFEFLERAEVSFISQVPHLEHLIVRPCTRECLPVKKISLMDHHEYKTYGFKKVSEPESRQFEQWPSLRTITVPKELETIGDVRITGDVTYFNLSDTRKVEVKKFDFDLAKWAHLIHGPRSW